ncbi:restriction endonuclease subunit S [Faecalibacterium wellingii]|nr:restriction endonuclease subunit S [Faecalibacterium sp. HTF-F]UQK55948.1 restriction endonuclease subunit S [Faecalibacterium sp. HTF-F]
MKTREVKLGEVANVKGGKRIPKGIGLINIPNGHPYIRVRDLNNKRLLELDNSYEYVDNETQKVISKYTVKTGDVVLSIVGTIGLVAIVGRTLDGANLTENCVKLSSFHGVNRDFLYYYLRSDCGQQEIRCGTVGAVQAKLPIKNIQNIAINLPDYTTQERIASLLLSIDRKIELNQKINDNLQQQAMALYAEMFLNSSNNDVTSGTLSDIAVITMGQSPSGSSYNEDGVGEVFYQGRAEFGFRFPKRRLFTTEPKRMAVAGDVLLSVRAPVGDLNMAYERCCIGRGLGAIHSKTGHSSFVLYTMFALRSQLNVFNGEGTVFGSINRDALNAIPIDVPLVTKIDQFEAVAHPIDELIRTNYEENCRLEAIRNSLLPKLMSGEIDVSAIRL